MKKTLLTAIMLTLLLSSKFNAQTHTELTITEVMFRPSVTNGEFVELYNTSTTTSLDLDGLKIKYHTSTSDVITGHAMGTILGPEQYAVIFEGDYDFASGDYNALIPAGALVLKITTVSFGTSSSGMAGTSDREIKLLDASDVEIESYTYSAGNSSGISDEKINITKDNSAGNWGNTTNSNGTPGSINTLSPIKFDVGINSISLGNNPAIEKEPFELNTKIENNGTDQATNFTVNIYIDEDNDFTGDLDEKISTHNIASLNSGSTTTLVDDISNLEEGTYTFIAEVDFASDQNALNDEANENIEVMPAKRQFNDLVINEIMYDPIDDAPEWIELYNNSDEIINITDWILSDLTSSIIIPQAQNLFPGEFMVLAESARIRNYFSVPERLIIVDLPSFNNSGDKISIYQYEDTLIDEVEYFSSWGGDDNISLERIDPDGESDNEENWGSSIDEKGGTPGKSNSILIKNYDLSLSNVLLTPEIPFAGDSLKIELDVINVGKNNADNFTVSILDETNGVNVFEESFANLASNDTANISTTISNLEEKTYNFIFQIDFSQDENLTNNSDTLQVIIAPAPNTFNDVVINEIMYKPQSGEPEWVELFNRSDEEINLRGWQFLDASSSFNFATDSLILLPNEYLVLSDDEAISDFHDVTSTIIFGNLPSLNNSGDFIAIKDSLDRFIDSLTYQSSWGGNSGTSLERIDVNAPSSDEDNWESSTSIFKGTPGNVNSVAPVNYDLAITSFSVEKELIIGDEKNKLSGTIKNLGKFDTGEFKLIVDKFTPSDSISGNTFNPFFEETFNGLLTGDSLNFEIENLPSEDGVNNFSAQIISSDEEKPDNNFATTSFNKIETSGRRGDIAINEIMYAPLPPEPEWLEFYNTSLDTINIDGYSLADRKDTVVIIDEDFFVLPGQYFIIAKEEAFFEKYNLDSNVIINSFPSLNNSGDQIILLNPFGGIIDSLEYSSKWGGSNGKSLERINPELASSDSANWSESQSPGGSSPGGENATIVKNHNIAINSIISTPEKPFKGDNVNLSIEIENQGDTNSVFVLNLFEDTNHDQIEDNLIYTSAEIELLPNEKTTFIIEDQLQNIAKNKSVVVTAELNDDSDLSDNKINTTILIGYPPNSLVINEIMYKPQSGEPEWVELYNNSSDQVDLKDWEILDVLTNPVTRKITDDFISIEPQSYLVIAKDSSILSFHDQIPSQIVLSSFANLNNTDDGIVIKDAHGSTIDSVFYKSTWESENGSSIERKSFDGSSVDSTNWNVSSDVEQSTPGRKNSGGIAIQRNHDLAVNEISFTPESPVKNDNIFVSAKTVNIGDTTATNFSVNFYYQIQEALILFSEENDLELNSGDSLTITSSNSFSITEQTIVKAEVIFESDENPGNNFKETEINIGFALSSILITEIMYSPIDGEPEWVELYNNSNEQINVFNWGISDATSSIKNISPEILFVSPGEFFIVTSDSSELKNIYNVDFKIFQASFGSLGNSGDAVFIYDPLNNVIDSVEYSPEWGGTSGFSLERVNFANQSQESENWSTSLSFDRATPGILNSVSEITVYSKDQIIINEIMFEPDTDNAEFIEIYNNSDSIIEIGGFNFVDDKDDATPFSPHLYSFEPKEYFIIASDSSFFSTYPFVDENIVSIINSSSLGLSNDEDVIVIKDFFGNTIDSLKYNSDWHNQNILNTKDRSLERLNPGITTNSATNWSTSVVSMGATPGEKNSIFLEHQKSESNISISPNPFSPDNDGFEDFTSINYSLSKPIAQVRIKIYDSKGRLVRTLSNNQSVGASGSIIFDGLNEDGNALKMGIYIVYMEVVDALNGSTESFKEAIVVARKL